MKQSRDQDAVASALTALREAAEKNENIMPLMVKAALANATVGEMMGAMRGVFGDFKKGLFPAKTSRHKPVLSIESEVPVRVLVLKPGLDGHDRGLNLVTAAFKNAGVEVIYAGLRQTPAMAARAAVLENVDVIGISSLSGFRLQFVRDLMKELRKYGADQRIKVVVGGITEDEGPYLRFLGVDHIFDPSHDTGELHQALSYLQTLADRKAARSELRNDTVAEKSPFKRILVVGAKDPALGVVQIANERGIETIATHWDGEPNELVVAEATESVKLTMNIGQIAERDGEQILAAALEHGVDVIHPGSGLLAETINFIEAVEVAGLTVIGPSSDALKAIKMRAAAKGTEALPDRIKRYGVSMPPTSRYQFVEHDTNA